MTKPNKYDNEKAHIYTLTLDLLTNLKQKTSIAFILIGLLYSSIIGIYLYFVFSNLKYREKSLRETLEFLGRMIFELVYITFPYFSLSFFILQALRIMSSKLASMDELKGLISTKRQRHDGQKRSYPIMNILDPKSLKSWASLRKIFMHLDDEKLQGQILAVTFVMVTELMTLIIVALSYLKILSSEGHKDQRYLSIFGLKTIPFLSTFFVLVYYAAKVNKQFKTHKNIIRENKQIAIVLFSEYSDFVGENAIEPGTFLYSEGVKFLKKEFGEDLTPEVQANMKQKLDTLVKYYDGVLEELDLEEIENPIKILGVPITSTVVKSFGTLLVSLSAPILKSGIASFYELIKSKL